MLCPFEIALEKGSAVGLITLGSGGRMKLTLSVRRGENDNYDDYFGQRGPSAFTEEKRVWLEE